MGALNFLLPIGQQVSGAALSTSTTLVGTTQKSVALGAYRLQCTNSGSNVVQNDARLTDFRIANQSVFTSGGDGAPVAMLQAAVQANDYVAGISLAAGTSVSMTVLGGAAVGGYDVGAWICTDDLPPGTEAGFDLESIALIFPRGRVVVPGGAGNTVVRSATCNRSCTLGKLFLSSSSPDMSVVSVLISGVEQFAQSTTVGVPISAFGGLATMENGDFDLATPISAGEAVSITIRNAVAGAGHADGGIYCL